MDITTLAARDTATITLLHPANGEPIVNDQGVKATVTLFGPGSKQHQAARAARERRLMATAIANQGKGKGKPVADPEQDRLDVAADLAACTASIEGWTYKGGTDAKAIEAAYADTTIGWIADQVQRALGDWGNFLPEQSPS